MIKIGKNIKIWIEGEKPSIVYYKNIVISCIKSFTFSLTSTCSNFVSISTDTEDPFIWDFVKELHSNGFHIKYFQQGDLVELYYKDKKSIIEFHPLINIQTGFPKNRKGNRSCISCKDIITEREFECKTLH